MFQGMASGHSSMSTFHAGSLDAVVKRLTTPPINLSPVLLESLNSVIIMSHAKEIGKSARRIKELTEIVSVDPKTEEVKTNVVFVWNPTTDTFDKVNDSVVIRKLIEAKGGELETSIAELERKKRIIEWMSSQGIKDYLEVTKYINMYYKEPEKLMTMMKEKYEQPKKIELPKKIEIPKEIIEEKMPIAIENTVKRVSLLELLGSAMVKNKK
jgi:flagellar protein FlaI